MKKYFLSALALPLLFACSSEDYLDQKATDNDQFAGIEKVDATFSMANDPSMRMKSDWELEEGDQYGFAWLGGGEATSLAINGKAWQNHPLTQTGDKFVPQTSIYVGKYFLYRPYDETVVNIDEINFKSLEKQTIVDGRGTGWAPLAKNAIIIGDKWTNVKKGGTPIGGETWNQAGINHQFKIYAAIFSNQTGLDLKYEKNNEVFDGKKITGATDINYTYPEGSKIGAADIYGGTVELDGAAKSFTYAPGDENKEPVKVAGVDEEAHSGTFWANKSNVATAYGFNFLTEMEDPKYDVITLNVDDKNGISTDKKNNKGWFWFNSLPVTAGNATSSTAVKTVLNTSYGTVTINSTVGECAYENFNFGTEDVPDWQWVKLVAGTTDDLTSTQKKWAIDAGAPEHNTFVNQYGNHAGKYELTVDFSKGVMTDMHITDDKHLQKALKYYIASGKDEDVVLNLDQASATDNTFKISKISIALIQTIQAAGKNVKVQACTEHGTPKIIVTQDGSEGKTEVPALDKVFATATDVYLASATNWTWTEGAAAEGKIPEGILTIDDKVKSITNEGTLTVNATNVQLSEPNAYLLNASGATMNITKVTTVKNILHNYGTINVGSSTNDKAELRAYGAKIYNNATDLDAHGVINNYGVVGSTSGTSGEFHNWGLIKMMNDDAMTLLKSNEKGTDPFGKKFNKTNYKMGTVVLPKNNPTAIVSVANTAENGFIEYPWTDKTYATPAGNVKYNTIVVSNDITFTEDEKEIQYIRFTGVRKQVVNPVGNLTKLKGIIVDNKDHNASIIIEKTNEIKCSVGAFLGTGATVYLGGAFTYPAGATTNYFGTWSTDQIVEWGK